MITKIQSNIKGQTINAQLHSKTLIVGPSASGKSSITGAIELAISNRISDVQGRDSALKTVGKMIAGQGGLKLEAQYEGEKPKLLFQEIKSALQKSPLAGGLALLDLMNINLDLVNEYKAFENLRKTSQNKLKQIESALGLPEFNDTRFHAMIALLNRATETCQQEIDRLGLVLDGMESQLKVIVSERLKPLVMCSETYIPESLGALVLDNGRVGLRKQGIICYALSGSEWNIVVTALACGVAEISKHPAVIIPDDRAIDHKLLEKWLICLSDSRSQILITSVNAPNNIPAPWELLLL